MGSDSAEETMGAPDRELRASRGLTRGDIVGRYVVLEGVGSGGMGVVFAAYDPELDRRVALKLLHGHTRERDDPGARMRLVREAQAMARVSHPNVITVHDAGEHGGLVFVAMEFIDGLTVGQWFEQAKPDWRTTLEVLRAAGRGVAAAHGEGLVHRDFKPDNVMLERRGDAVTRVVVMDFGLAMPADKPVVRESADLEPTVDAFGERLTNDGSVMGTPAYMAPEQHMGGAVGAAADQFAFCVALYEGLYGERPFAGSSLAELADNVTSGSLRPAPAGASVPLWLRRTLLRGLAVDPEDRWPTMGALLDALGRDPTRRRRWWFAAASVGLVLAGGYTWQQRSRAVAEAACVDAGNEVTQWWNESREDEVREALAATELAFSSVTASTTIELLDTWTAQWSHARTQVCLDGLRDAEAQQREHAIVDCLDAAAAAGQTLVDELAGADLNAARWAVTTASGLRKIETCMESPSAADRDHRPSTDAGREVAQLAAQSWALRGLNKPKRALELALRALEVAREGGEDGPTVDALTAAGLAERSLGRFSDARAHLEEAFYLAGATRMDDYTPTIAQDLLQLERYADQLDRADDWRRVVEMLQRRAGVAEGEPRWALLQTDIGNLAHARGDYEAAADAHRRALRAWRELEGPGSNRVADSLLNLSSAEAARGNLDAAIEATRSAREIYEPALGGEHPRVAAVWNNLGVLHDLAGRADEAIAAHRTALRIRTAVLGEGTPPVAASLMNLGNALETAGRFAEALEILRRARADLVAIHGEGSTAVAEADVNLGVMLARNEDHPSALTHYTRAQRVLEQNLSADHPHVASALINAAESHEARGEYAIAVDKATRAIGIRETRALDPVETAVARVWLADLMWQAGQDPARARAHAERARAELSKLEGADEELAKAERWLSEHPAD